MSTRKLAAASFANLLIPASGLLVSPFLSRELGSEGRGLYAALTLPLVVYGWLGTWGLQDALSYHMRDERLNRRGAATVILIGSVPLGLLSIVLLDALGLVIFDSHRYHQFLLLTLLAPLQVTSNLLIGALTGSGDIRGVNLVKVVPALARTALVIAACLAFDLDAFTAGLIFLSTAPLGLVPGLWRLLRTRRAMATRPAAAVPDLAAIADLPTQVLPLVTTARPYPFSAAPAQFPPAVEEGDPRTSDDNPTQVLPAVAGTESIPVRSMFRYAMACLPGTLAAVSSARLDQVIGLPVIGARQLGYYAVAVSVAEIPMVIATAARTVLMGKPSTSDPVGATRVARLAVLASLLTCGILALVVPFAVPLFFGEQFRPAWPAAAVLCAATVLYTYMTLFTAVLLAAGKARSSSVALVVGSVFGIVLLFAFAPLGALGAALASLGGYGLSALVAAVALHGAGTYRLRMIVAPYREDLVLLGERLASLLSGRLGGRGRHTVDFTMPTRASLCAWVITTGRRTGFDTVAVALLFVLSWLRLVVPTLLQMFSSGRPAFNATGSGAQSGFDTAVGTLCTLGFIMVTLVLIARGVWDLVRAGTPSRPTFGAGIRRLPNPWPLAVALAPIAALELSTVVNHQAVSMSTVGFPFAAVALWLRPPPLRVLSTLGVLGAVSAAISMLLALVRPDLALLQSAEKSGPLGDLLAGPYLHSNVLGIVLTLSLPFVFVIEHAVLRWCSLILILLALVWTGSRTSELACLAVLVVAVLLRRYPTRLWIASTAILGGLLLIIVVPLVTTDPAGFTRRGRIWMALLRHVAEKPILGHGSAFFETQPNLGKELGGNFTHGHNIMVHLLTIGGVVAFALFLALLLLVWRQCVTLARRGFPAGLIFLVAFVATSWLEASHIAITLAGYQTWLPLLLIAAVSAIVPRTPQPGAAREPVPDTPVALSTPAG